MNNQNNNISSQLTFQCRNHANNANLFCLEGECKARTRIICNECIESSAHYKHKHIPLENVLNKLQEARNQQNTLYQNALEQLPGYQEQIKIAFHQVREQIKTQLKKMENNWVQTLQILVKNPKQTQHSLYLNEVFSNLNNFPQLSADKKIFKFLQNIIIQPAQMKPDDIIPSHIPYTLNKKTKLLENSMSEYIAKQLSLLENLMFSQQQFQAPFDSTNFKAESQAVITNNSYVSSLIALNENTYASGDEHGKIKIWEIGKTEPTNVLQGHLKQVWSLLKVEGNIIVSASRDKEIKIWNWREAICLNTLSGHTEEIRSLEKIDEDLIVSASQDKTIRIWEWREGKFIKEVVDVHQSFVNSVIKIDDQRIATASDDKSVKIWQVGDFKLLKQLNFEVGQWSMLKINEDYMAVGDYFGKIRIFRIKDLYCELILEGHSQAISRLIYLDSDLIASASNDYTVKLWQWRDGSCYKTLKGHISFIYSVILLNSRTLITGSNDKKMVIWH